MPTSSSKRSTKSNSALIREIERKLTFVNKTKDLMAFNRLIDKLIAKNKSKTPEESFGEEWTNKAKRLGHLIKGFRSREGLTQIDLAKKLKGVNQSNISAWESGKEPIPEKRLKQLSKLFGRDLEKIGK